MLSVNEAESLILNLVQPLDRSQDVETIDLLAANNRILSDPVISQLDFPHWDNSAMDGYAVRYADVHCCESTPKILEIIEEIPAGIQPQSTIQSGQAARIFTGAVMPQGADTVVMQENTQRQENRVLILTSPKLGEFIRHRGAYYESGKELLPAGIMLNAPEIAILAAAQCTQLNVYRRPRVAILSTGNELITPDKPLQRGQIVDSNQYALAALVKQCGAEPVMLGIVKDQPVALRQAVAEAIASGVDIILSSGGVSVGDYDYVEQIIESLDGKIHIRAVAMKPGKPLTVATFPSLIYFGLPGNPVSALVSYWRLVQPAIKKLAGLRFGYQPMFVLALTKEDLHSHGQRETYTWGKLQLTDGVYEFIRAGGSHSSGNLINLAQTNALAIMPVGQTSIVAGAEILVLQT